MIYNVDIFILIHVISIQFVSLDIFVTNIYLQASMDNCIQKNFDMERPHYGYHCLPRVGYLYH